jgi:hypothetical protein
VCLYIHTYIYVYVHVYMYICMCVCVCVHIYTYIHTYNLKYDICMYVCMYMSAYIYMYIYILCNTYYCIYYITCTCSTPSYRSKSFTEQQQSCNRNNMYTETIHTYSTAIISVQVFPGEDFATASGSPLRAPPSKCMRP